MALFIDLDPTGYNSSISSKAGESWVFSLQLTSTASRVFSMADDGFVFAVYRASDRQPIDYFDATITQDEYGDIALWVLPGSISEKLYAESGLRWDIAQRGFYGSRETIFQGSINIGQSAPSIEDMAGEPVARYIQKIIVKNDPQTLREREFKVTMAAYVPNGTVTPTPTPTVTLGTLGLSATSATVGTSYNGTITGATTGSTLSASNLPAGLTLNSSSRTITGTPTPASTANFTLVETLAGASNSPRINGVTLTINAAPVAAPTLSTLSLGSTSGQVGTAFNAVITGATSGSMLTASNLPAGLTLNSSARTITGTPTATASSFTLIETLGGATGSPKSNTIALTISAAPVTASTTNTLSNSSLLPTQVSGAHEYFTAREARISRLETAFAS